MPRFQKTSPSRARPAPRDYLRSMHGSRIGSGSARIGGRLSSLGRMAGQAGSMLFKELTKPGPKSGVAGSKDAQEQYGLLKRVGGEMTLEEALRHVADLPPPQQKLAKAHLWLSSVPNLKREAVTPQKVALARKKLIELVGEKEAERALKPLEGMFQGRREVSGAEGGKRVRERSRDLESWQRDLSAEIIEGLDQKKTPINRRNKQVITHQNIAQTRAKLAKKYGEHAATRFARPFYPLSAGEKAGQPPPSRSASWFGKFQKQWLNFPKKARPATRRYLSRKPTMEGMSKQPRQFDAKNVSSNMESSQTKSKVSANV